MNVKKIPAVVREVEPEKFVLELNREELQAIFDDVNAGKGLDCRSTAGILSMNIWKQLARVLQN